MNLFKDLLLHENSWCSVSGVQLRSHLSKLVVWPWHGSLKKPVILTAIICERSGEQTARTCEFGGQMSSCKRPPRGTNESRNTSWQIKARKINKYGRLTGITSKREKDQQLLNRHRIAAEWIFIKRQVKNDSQRLRSKTFAKKWHKCPALAQRSSLSTVILSSTLLYTANCRIVWLSKYSLVSFFT